MLAKKKASKVATTASNYPHYKYPNCAKDLKPTRINEPWVSDLTYISIGVNYAYLYIIMDAFSRKIVGWSLQKTMHAQGALYSLEMALSAHKDISQSLIHHSDRGVQYCSWAYVQRFRQANATISMTESGDPNENAMAERVLRSLKDDCKLARGFSSFSSAEEAVERAINAYNTVRPHASLNYLTAPADGPTICINVSESSSFAGIRIKKSGTEMCNMRPYLGNFNICPTQSVAY
jgi:transposase InsO family protein